MAREGYIELAIPADADPDALRERFIASIQEAIPGWEPADGDIVVRIGDGTGEMAADREAMVIDVSRELFRKIGAELFAVTAIEAAAATGEITWDVTTDTTIDAGTQVTIDGVGFEVSADTAVLAATPVDVPVVALIAGAAQTGVSGTVEVLDAEALLITESVTLVAPTIGGRDPEALDVYEDRLSARLAHLGRPTLPADFSDRARDITGVHRALTIDNYKPGPPWDVDPADDEAERTVTVISLDEAGADVSTGTRNELDAYLQAQREINFEVWVINATRTPFSVAATITVWDGYTPADVTAAAEDAVTTHLDPARYGTPPGGDQPVWEDTPIVDRGAIEAAILAVPGVRRVVTLELFYFAEDFSGDLSAYTITAGPGTIAASGGELVPSDTTEKRFVRTGLSVLDSRGSIKYRTGATLGATATTDLILKGLDNDDLLLARVSRTDSKMSVRKMVAGAASEIAADAGTFTTLLAATTYWARAWVDGNIVTIEHWTTDPALGGTPARTFTHTLTGADATTYGTGVTGAVGARLFPGSTTWRYDDLRFDSPDEDLELVGPAALPQLVTATVTAP